MRRRSEKVGNMIMLLFVMESMFFEVREILNSMKHLVKKNEDKSETGICIQFGSILGGCLVDSGGELVFILAAKWHQKSMKNYA